MTEDDQKKEIEQVKKEQEGVPTLITPLHSIARQIGEHVMTALEHGETVAVLTTITGSQSGKQVVSIPLTSEHLHEVHSFIEDIHESDEPERIPCVGFHCLVDNDESPDD